MTSFDRFFSEYEHLKTAKIGLLTNHASYCSAGYHVSVELLRKGFNLSRIFSPEHGITAQGADGTTQKDIVDSLTGLPVVSLYGSRMTPGEEDLADLSSILIDLPNIGCRFYTYFWTISYVTEACASFNKKIILLDRPNLSGRNAASMEGPLLDEQSCSSFLGRWSMPLTFSLSYGELLSWFIRDRKINVDFEVIPFEKEQEQVFIPPSPSINGWQSAITYPCTALFEGFNLNTGRGTSTPFRVLGAPWIDPLSLCEDFHKEKIPGVKAFPYSFRPEWSRYAGETCHGLIFHVQNPMTYRPVQTGIWLIQYLVNKYPDQIAEARYPTLANPTGRRHLDLLAGIPDAFHTFSSPKSFHDTSMKELLDVSGWISKVSSHTAF